jgi:hypothetical protein
MPLINRAVLLANRPSGMPSESDFRLVEQPVRPPGEGEFVVRIHYISVDPYQRGRMRDAPSYARPVGIGEVMTGGGVGRVIESRHPGFAEGEHVEGMFGWQEYAVSSGEGVRKVDPSLAPLSTALGVLGMPGLTAYFGVLEIGRPRAGETVLVSGAGGAVGSAAGQIAKLQGCRVAGIAGSDEKVRWITGELGFDAAFNYKTAPDLRRALAEVCPGGVDFYFDNVGGEITDAAIMNLNERARVAVCGQISQYNTLDRVELGPRLFWRFLIRRARLEGFLVFDFADRYGEALARLAQWVAEGRLKYRETILDGIENAPRAFLQLFEGGNIGKQLVRL